MRADWWKLLTLAVLLGGFSQGGLLAQEGVWQGGEDRPMVRAALKDRDRNARQHAIVVEVETRNIGLVPSGGSSYAGSDVGLLEYQVDQNPVLATDDTAVMFRDLAPGKHTITVSLVNPEYKELGAKAELEIAVP